MSVSDLANLMKLQFSSFQQSTKDELKRMSDSLSTQMHKLRADISADIEQLREEHNNTFSKLTNSIEKAKSDAVAAVDRNMRMNDLIVSGVPYTPNENLLAYFSMWCRSLGYAENSEPLVDIRRLTKGTPIAGAASVLLIQFAITVQRNDFYARYLRSRSLSLLGIGFSVDQRIYMNESLAPTLRVLRSKALAMKRNGQLSGVNTKDGIIYVRMNGNDRAVAVTSESDLEDIVQR